MSGKQTLIDLLSRAYNKRSWHGTNLRGSIRGLSLKDVSWRPGKKRHSIQEVVVHCAYWKYTVRRRMLGKKRGSFTLRGSNWFPRPGTSTRRQWSDDVALLEREHRLLVAAVRTLSDARLRRRVGREWTAAGLIAGIASHDLYHAGQIQLLKRLRRRG